MKTLKRSMALVLALVMVVGMLGVGAVAYNDDDKITYKTAVETMTALQVLDGLPGGDFGPDQKMDRAMATKVATHLILGPTYAKQLVASKQVFDDVPLNHWAANHIEFCAKDGIVNGVGGNLFKPEGEVSGAEFAKVLVAMLGYGKNDELVGANWYINTMKFATTAEVFKNNTGGATMDPATREELALYAYNVLNTPMVNYNKDSGVYEEVKIVTSGQNEYPITHRYKTLAVDVFGLEQEEGPVHFKRGNYYVRNNVVDFATVYDIGRVAFINRVDDKVVGEYEYRGKTLGETYEGTSSFVNYTKEGSGVFLGSVDKGYYTNNFGERVYYDSEVFYNGESVGSYAKLSDDILKAGAKNGSFVKFIDDGSDRNADRILIVAPLASTLTGDPKAKTTGGRTLVTIPGTEIYDVEDSKIMFDYTDLKEGDVVGVFEIGDTGYFHIEEYTDTVEGKIERITVAPQNQVKVRIDGEDYDTSELIDEKVNPLNGFAIGDEVVLTLDKGGYVVDCAYAGEADELHNKIVYVIETERFTTSYKEEKYEAKVVTEKGDVVVADVAEKFVGTNTAILGNADTHFVKLTKNNKTGKYSMTQQEYDDTGYADGALNPKLVGTGDKQIEANTKADLRVSSKTVYIIKSTVKGGDVYKAYVGFAAPKYSGDNSADSPAPGDELYDAVFGSVVESANVGVASHVYIDNGDDADDASVKGGVFKTVLFTERPSDYYGDVYRECNNVIIDGEKQTIVLVADERTVANAPRIDKGLVATVFIEDGTGDYYLVDNGGSGEDSAPADELWADYDLVGALDSNKPGIGDDLNRAFVDGDQIVIEQADFANATTDWDTASGTVIGRFAFAPNAKSVVYVDGTKIVSKTTVDAVSTIAIDDGADEMAFFDIVGDKTLDAHDDYNTPGDINSARVIMVYKQDSKGNVTEEVEFFYVVNVVKTPLN